MRKQKPQTRELLSHPRSRIYNYQRQGGGGKEKIHNTNMPSEGHHIEISRKRDNTI